MFDFSKSLFDVMEQIPQEAEYIFVADLFADEYSGGAELTTEALIQSAKSSSSVTKLKAKNLTKKIIEQNRDKFWIFCNCSTMNNNLIPSIISMLNYCVIEYDYKFCVHRSIEKHMFLEHVPCNCHNSEHGKMIASLYKGAKILFWMSETQKNIYHTRFSNLSNTKNIILSSVFSDDTLNSINKLKFESQSQKKSGWIVLGSQSWVKGYENALNWCRTKNINPEIVWGLSYDETLKKIASAEGFVYLPNGGDTCPRMVIEAKMLDCKLIINDHVQHKNEQWFTGENHDMIEHLANAKNVFWNSVNDAKNDILLSGYTQTRNCIEQKYPWRQSIISLLGFCDEVVVIDGGSTDGTWEELQKWSIEEPKLVLKQLKRDWNDKRFALFDGQQKAYAREQCKGKYCWQQDIDEVVNEHDYEKIRNIAKNFPEQCDLIALPVIEYWGGHEKVRVDVNPWKWRLSRNVSNITHGIPKNHRAYDENGELYSLGSDGCDYIFCDTFESVPFATFYHQDVEKIRLDALNGNASALKIYENWAKNLIKNVPSIYHYSWFNIERKIHTYKNYWSKHWMSLFNKVQTDIPENNMFFEKSWSEVTDDEIEKLATRMKNDLGGWIFHTRIDFNCPTPWITISESEPKIMNSWTNHE